MSTPARARGGSVELDTDLAAHELFRDPERLAEAELVLERMRSLAQRRRPAVRRFARAELEVGALNQLAVRAADAIVAEPGKRYNPLFVHGPSGVGKTHLLNAIGNGLIAAERRRVHGGVRDAAQSSSTS